MSWVTSTRVLPALRFSSEHVGAFLGEGGVADGEDFVDEHHVGVGFDHDREREADHHSRGVVLQFEVDEFPQLGEVQHGVQASPGFAASEAHHDAVELDVLAGGQLGVEADAELDERRQPAGHPDPPGVGAVDAGQHFEQRALARPVTTDDPEELALVHLEVDSAQRLELAIADLPQGMRHPLLERVNPLVGDPEGLVTDP